MDLGRTLHFSHQPSICDYSNKHFPLTRHFQKICPIPCVIFRNKYIFRVLNSASRPTPTIGSSLVGCPRQLTNTFAAILHT